MTLDSQRGDIGNLALADAALGALLIQIAEMVEEANYPDPPKKISQSLPTGRAARLVEKQVACYADLFPDQFGAWLEQVVTATDMRNKIMHAVAVDTCVECGNATLFRHAPSGDYVNRTDASVHLVTVRIEELHQRGDGHAHVIAELVNVRTTATARATAETTGEVKTPPQVSADRAQYVCRDCHPNGRGAITVKVGTAVAVYPRAEFEKLRQALGDAETADD